MDGNLDMNGNTINDVDIIANQLSVTTSDKQSAIHIRIDDTTKELSFYKESPDTGDVLPLGALNIDTPTKETHAVNKRYVDSLIGKFEEKQNQLEQDLIKANKKIANLTEKLKWNNDL